MKKVFIARTKWFTDELFVIKRKLELMGYEVILSDCFYEKENNRDKEKIEFNGNKFLKSKTKDSDIILVLNFKKLKNKIYYPNYKNTVDFLKMCYYFDLENNVINYS